MDLIPASCTAAERCGVGLSGADMHANSCASCGVENIAVLSSGMKRQDFFIQTYRYIFIHENYDNMGNCNLGRDSSKDDVGGRWLSLRTKITLYYDRKKEDCS